MRIVVMTNAFVFVCKSMVEHDTGITLHNARCIQTWGTKTGLGQLVNGPTKETVLNDMIPIITAPIHSLVFSFEVSSAWEKHL